MSFRFAPGRGNEDPWFRVGTVDVTTSVLVAALSAVSMVVIAFAPGLFDVLALDPDLALRGRVWPVVTWPLANPVSLWTVLAIFFFWYFGSDLESTVGRRRFTWMILGFTVAMAMVAIVVGLALPGTGQYLFGLNTLQLMVLLTWVAEYPTRRFLFNIPAWVFGAVIVGLQVLGYIAARDVLGLLTLLISLFVCALIARAAGLLTELSWLPNVHVPHRQHGNRAQGQPRQPRRRKGRGSSTVVAGPWDDQHRSSSPAARDRARLDELLDKISEKGMDGLSEKEKQELLALRDRLSGG